MEQSRGQRMPRNAGWKLFSICRCGIGNKFFLFGEVTKIDSVNNQECQPCNQRNPNKKPGNMNWDALSQRTHGPLYDAHAASCTPLMARFTRFRISGIL